MQSISKSQSKMRGSEKQMVIVRETEGALAIENYIMACWRNREDDDEIANSSMLNEFSKKLFGITFADAQLEITVDQKKMLDTPEKEEE
jgi:hypothetical protein